MAKVFNKADKIMICIIAGVFLIASLVGLLVYTFQITDYTTVATFNGMKITAGELRDQMLRDRSEIIKYYQDKHNISVEEGFWDIKLEGTTPIAKLRETALENIKEDKAKLQLAVKYKIINDASYKAFIKALNEENAEREAKINRGEVIYGPTEYNVDSYHDYYISNIEIMLKEKMSEKDQPLYATDDQLRAFYDEIKDVYYLNSDNANFKCFTLTFQGGGEESEYTDTQAKQIMEKVRNIIETDKNYEETIAKQYPDVVKKDLALTKENASQASKTDPILYSVAKDLKAGQISDVFTDKFDIRVVICIDRKSNGYMAFEEYTDTVESQYQTEKLKEQVAAIVEKHSVDTNWKFNSVKVK